MSLTLCVLEIMPPQWPDLVLTADIPHCKTDVLEFYRLNVKTCGQMGIIMFLILAKISARLGVKL